MEYVFYFDESFHDRKITLSEKGIFNVLEDNALDNYIGVFWGCKQKTLHRNIRLINDFEVEQRKLFGLNNEIELKSTIIGKRNFEYGISSFNKKTTCFYRSLFTLFDSINPIVQITAISKMEFFIRQSFKGFEFPKSFGVNENNFYYSFTKLMIVYKNKDLFKAIYNAQNNHCRDEMIEELLFTLDSIIVVIMDIPRKQKEVQAFIDLRRILTFAKFQVNIQEKLNFTYKPNFDGLCRLLGEISINTKSIKLILDKEENTFKEALTYPFGKVKQSNSENSMQLHLSDFLSSFIGRMMYALSNDQNFLEDRITNIEDIGDYDLKRKRLLSAQWFNIDEEKFKLYKLIHSVIIEKNIHYWTIMTFSYSDQVVVFLALLRHFASYDSFDSFNAIKTEMHSEFFNARCCDEIQRHFNR